MIVVEARKKSGSMITVEHALAQGRNVYAVPGPLNSALSEGCHELIRQGAAIFTGAKDFCEDLYGEFILSGHTQGEKVAKGGQKADLSDAEQRVYDALPVVPIGAEVLASELSMDSLSVKNCLVSLLLKGLAKEEGKGYFYRL